MFEDEQDGFGSFPLPIRTEKVPPAGGGVAPCKQRPRIIKHYAQIATATGQARQARRRRSPCRRSAMLSPCCCFWRPALTEQGAKTIAYNHPEKRAKQETTKHNASKETAKETSKHTNKKADRAIILKYQARKSKHKKTIKTSKAIYKHLTISKGKKDKQDKKKSKRDPRKAYKQTSKREKQSYTIIPCYYIAMLLIYIHKHI